MIDEIHHTVCINRFLFLFFYLADKMKPYYLYINDYIFYLMKTNYN